MLAGKFLHTVRSINAYFGKAFAKSLLENLQGCHYASSPIHLGSPKRKFALKILRSKPTQE